VTRIASLALQLAGLGGVGYGLWEIWPPLAAIIGGVLVMLIGYGMERPSPPRR
jgi:hypothetical protein